MKIRIKTKDYRGYVEFSVTGIYYSLDDNKHPIDIIIYGTEDTLKAIAEFANGDGNMQPIGGYYPDEIEMKNLGATHVVLFARLNEFEEIVANY